MVRIASLRLAAIAACLLVVPVAVPAHVDAGEPVEPTELTSITGERQPLLARNVLNVLVFFRPGNERSLDTLQRVAECEKVLASKPVHLVGVVSSSAPVAEVRAVITQAGVKSPVLIDEADSIYGKLELRQHPVVVIVDRKNKVAAIEPYQRLRYCDVVKARIAFLLGEIKQAELDKVLVPPKAEFPTEMAAGGGAGRYVKMGDMELRKGNCALAVKAFDNALAKDPRNQAALAGKARCASGSVAPEAPAKP